MLATLIAVAGLAVLPAPQAAADDHLVNQVTELGPDCVVSSPIGQFPLEDLLLNITSEFPTTIARGATGEVRIQQEEIEVPPELDFEGLSAIINNATNSIVRFRPPAGFQVVDVRSEGGQNGLGQPIASSATYSQTTNVISWVLPGPFTPAQSPITPPDLVVELRATGSAGNVGNFLFDSFTTTSNVTIPDLITTDVSVVCSAGALNPPLAAITIVPGAFVPVYEPISTQTNLSGNCEVRYPARLVLFPPSANVTFPLNNVPFFVSRVPDIPPGAQTTVTIDIGAFDWVGAVPPGEALGEPAHIALALRNWRVDFRPPPGFQVVNVAAGSGMNAQWVPAENRIRWSRPAGAAGDIPPGLWTPPSPLSVTLQATAPAVHQGQFQLFGTTVTSGSTSPPGLWFDTLRQENLGMTTAVATTKCGAASTAASFLVPARNVPNQFNVVNNNANLGSLGVVVPPTAVNDTATAANNASVLIDVLANDVAGSFPLDPASVFIVDEPARGSVSVNPDGTVLFTPTLGTLETSDSFSYVVFDTGGRPSNLAVVELGVVGLYCVAGQSFEDPAPGCSLDQFLEFDVVGAPLNMQQDGANITLATITLDGEPQPTSGLLNELTVTNQRGDGQLWSVTGQVTDFKEDADAPDCPASVPSSWYYKCIPGDNLGWAPVAAVEHLQVPGDVAAVSPGSTISSGLSSTARTLCSTGVLTSGGTFTCGAVLTLITPASAAAQVYKATLTLTLA